MQGAHRACPLLKGCIIMAEQNIKKSCLTCEFNFGEMCAGYGKRKDNGKETYGSKIDELIEMFPSGCPYWGLSHEAYVKSKH